MSQHHKAIAALVAAAVLWSTGGFMIKLVDWQPLAIAGGRSLISAGVIWWFFRKETLVFSKWQCLGSIGYAACTVFFVLATKLTTAANAILLQYTAPIYVALLSSLFLGEKVKRRDWLTIISVIGGMIFFFIDQVAVGSVLGNFYAILAGIGFASCIVFMRKEKDKPIYGVVLFGNLLAFMISLCFWSEENVFSYSNVLGILLLGVFQLGISYTLYTYAIKHVEALKAVLITSLEPILNPIWVFLLLGEAPGFYPLIGGLIVMLAVTLNCYLDAKKSKEINVPN